MSGTQASMLSTCVRPVRLAPTPFWKTSTSRP